MDPRLTYASIPDEVKLIAKDSLGLGVLRSLLSYAHTYHLIIKISDGDVVGFSLYHFEETQGSSGESYIVGVVDCICVKDIYRRDGFGTILTFQTIRKMHAYGARRVELVLKTPAPEDFDSTPGFPFGGNGSLLCAMGFRKVKDFEGYFEQLSQRGNYLCRFCEQYPDTCQASLFVIDGA